MCNGLDGRIVVNPLTVSDMNRNNVRGESINFCKGRIVR